MILLYRAQVTKKESDPESRPAKLKIIHKVMRTDGGMICDTHNK